MKGLATHLVAVEVTTREKDKFTLKDAQVLKENVRSVHCLSKRKTRINLFLSNTGQFSAERCKFRVDCRLYIGCELSYNLFLLDVAATPPWVPCKSAQARSSRDCPPVAAAKC